MELTWLITAVLGFVVLYFLYYLLNINSDYWEVRGVPHIKSIPIVGIMKDVLLGRRGMGDITSDIYKQFDGEKFCGYFQFLTPTIMIRDPELINLVLIKDFTYFEDRNYPMEGLNDLFGLGINSLTGDEWRNARHKLTPTFTSGKLKMMFKPIKECSDEVVNYIESKSGQDFEAKNLILRCVLNIIANVAYGMKLDAINVADEQSKQFFQTSSKFFLPSFSFLMKIFIYLNFPKVRELLKLQLLDKDVDVYFRGLTSDVIKYRERTNTKRNDFLQLMLDIRNKEKENLGNGLSTLTSYSKNLQVESEDKELMDQLENTPVMSSESSKSVLFTEEFISAQTFIFVSGGSETVANVLSFVFYELAVNQELQKKVQDELDDVLSSQEFNYQDLKKMTYMEQFINETFRFHPINGTLMRMCTRDYKIPGTDIVIEKGTAIHIPTCGLHNDPQYFPDPKKFDPDRFENMDTIPKGVFFSFGAGPRICIAMRLAIIEMKVILATVLTKYTVKLSDKTSVPLKMARNSFILRSEEGVWVKFEERKI